MFFDCLDFWGVLFSDTEISGETWFGKPAWWCLMLNFKISKYLVSRCLNPQTSPEKTFSRVPNTSPGMTGGFWMSREWRNCPTCPRMAMMLVIIHQSRQIRWQVYGHIWMDFVWWEPLVTLQRIGRSWVSWGILTNIRILSWNVVWILGSRLLLGI